ncbi:MAG: DUF4492 domain-containing protein [Epsilonproteobacteria bacterium]|nr:DUF4492 domain-containing protein [Campylobacterota bacterium]
MKTIIFSIRKILSFYYEGFKGMKTGKTLWIIILIKLFVMFAIIKWLFFPDIMQEHFSSDKERSAYILDQLTKE